MNIWNAVKYEYSRCVLSGELIRVVESQEQIATNELVDSLEEQIQLEALLEKSKPAHRADIGNSIDNSAGNSAANNMAKSTDKKSALSYLLTTPFRYPPLLHGSRFGSRFEPSLFYASKTLSTAFSETAFYRFYFWDGMATKPSSAKYITEHTVFTAKYYSTNGLALNKPPFSQFEKTLTHPSHYKTTQALGTKLRENNVKIIEYISARDTSKGTNIALFDIDGFTNKKPQEQQQWLCETTEGKVSFSSKEGLLFSYSQESFLIDGKFPMPSA